MNYYIITGASKGLGKAITEQLIDKNNHLFCIARSKNNELIQKANNQDCLLNYYQYDLANSEGITELIDEIFTKIDLVKAERIYLFNNAGIIEPIRPVEKCTAPEMDKAIKVNLIAPMVITAAFLANTETVYTDKKIINISSGAAQEPYFGWSSYCTSKAGLDMFTNTCGLEQSRKENPTVTIAISPSIIDTDMQISIRSSKEEDFEDVERFIQFKEQGNLREPNLIAQKLIEVSQRTDLKQGEIYSVEQFT